MDEEPREKIAEAIWLSEHPKGKPYDQLGDDYTGNHKDRLRGLVDQILSLLKGLGYQKVPELKVLTEEELEKAKNDYINEDFSVRYIRDIRGHSEDTMIIAAQAQFDSIKRQIDDYNKLA